MHTKSTHTAGHVECSYRICQHTKSHNITQSTLLTKLASEKKQRALFTPVAQRVITYPSEGAVHKLEGEKESSCHTEDRKTG